MNLDKYDKIHLSEKDLPKLLEWRDQNKDLVRRCESFLNEGVITFGEFYKQYFEVKGFRVYFKLFIGTVLMLDFEWNRLFLTVKYNFVHKNLNYSTDGAMQDAITVFASLMAYIQNFQTEKQYVYQESQKVTKSSKKSKKKSGTVRFKKVVTVRVPSLDLLPQPKREHVITAESWSVRGHLRRYKSGKVVWVKPYTKGKGNKEVKTYEFEI